MSLINREALLAEYDRVHVGEPGKARKLIEDALTIELRCENCEAFNKTRLLIPQPERKKGKWITKSTNGEMFDVCSVCGYIEWDNPRNFCPNCGSYNGGENDDKGE